VTLPDGAFINAGEKVVKTWRLKNIGGCSWVKGYYLKNISGDLKDSGIVEITNEIKPGTEGDFSVTFIAPQQAGTIISTWQLTDPQGKAIGSPFYLEVFVSTEEVKKDISKLLGTWKGSAKAFGESGTTGGQTNELAFEFKDCAGKPCLNVVNAKDAAYHTIPFTALNKSEYCFEVRVADFSNSPPRTVYSACFSFQSDGTLAYNGGGPLWAERGTLQKTKQ
jgi:hypothetical protein